MTQAACPWCGQQATLRSNGRFRAHDRRGMACHLSSANLCEGTDKEPGPPRADVEREEGRAEVAAVVEENGNPACVVCQAAGSVSLGPDKEWRCGKCHRWVLQAIIGGKDFDLAKPRNKDERAWAAYIAQHYGEGTAARARVMADDPTSTPAEGDVVSIPPAPKPAKKGRRKKAVDLAGPDAPEPEHDAEHQGDDADDQGDAAPAPVQLGLDLKPVTASTAAGVACSVKLGAALTLEHEHFFMRVPADQLKKMRASQDRDAVLKRLAKKVRPLPDVDEIPRGAKATETRALVARALTVPVDDTVRTAMQQLLGHNGGGA